MAIPSAHWLQGIRGDKQVFVETGTHRGDGVNAALNAGFPCIYTTEVNPFDHGWCSHRFQHQRDRVHLHLEDSRAFLRKLVPTLTTRAVFWLDAHWCDSGGGRLGDVPLLKELRIIGMRKPAIGHTILIDDARYLTHGPEGFPKSSEIVRAIHAISRRYRIALHPSRDFPRDILVATFA